MHSQTSLSGHCIHDPALRFSELAAGNDDTVFFMPATAPRGNEIPDARSLLLFNDETAFPAMARTIETLPASSHASVFAEVDSRVHH